MPFRYPLVDEEPWRSKDIHKMLVEKYMVMITLAPEMMEDGVMSITLVINQA